MFWIRSIGCVSKREEKVFSLHTLFVLIPLHKPCEKSLLDPIVKKLPTGPMLSLNSLPFHVMDTCKLQLHKREH